MKSFKEFIDKTKKRIGRDIFGNRFDDHYLYKRFIPYYESQETIKVLFPGSIIGKGKVRILEGKGNAPMFMLVPLGVKTSNGYWLGPYARIIKKQEIIKVVK
jgi:hypothetical protein